MDEELLWVLADQVRFAALSIVVSMGVVAYMMHGHLPDRPWLWGGWLVLVAATQAHRAWRLPQLAVERGRPAPVRCREAAALYLLGILVQSLSLLAFPLFTPFEACVQTLIFMGIGVGAILTSGGWPAYSLGHILVTLVPLYLLWAWSGWIGQAGELGVLMALLGVGYMYTLWLISRRSYRLGLEIFNNRTVLEDALREAEAAGSAKTRFLATASHDLRQPIHALSLFSAALGMRDLDQRSRQISGSIDDAVQALSTQLDALLDVSKLDAGVVPVNRASVGLHDLLQRLAQELQAAARDNSIDIQIDCPKGARGWTDPALFERVLRNVITNAVVHNRECRLHLQVMPEGDCWHVTVRDTGNGIPERHRQQVFEEFYQVHNPERDRSRGLGLGLSIVKRLSTLLELQMQFDSVPGQGTRFNFTLPMASADRAAVDPGVEQGGNLAGLKVLVVDDEVAVRDAVAFLLQQYGCEVRDAEGSYTAVLLAKEWQPDVLLADYRLRGADSGLRTIRELRRLYSQLPAIMISGDTAPDRLREVEAAGIPMLHKPVPQQEIVAAIAAACGR